MCPGSCAAVSVKETDFQNPVPLCPCYSPENPIYRASSSFFISLRFTQVYTGDAAVMALTASLLLWVALYQVADNVQCVCIFVLRSWRVTLAPLLVYCTLLWGGGLGGDDAVLPDISVSYREYAQSVHANRGHDPSELLPVLRLCVFEPDDEFAVFDPGFLDYSPCFFE